LIFENSGAVAQASNTARARPDGSTFAVVLIN